MLWWIVLYSPTSVTDFPRSSVEGRPRRRRSLHTESPPRTPCHEKVTRFVGCCYTAGLCKRLRMLPWPLWQIGSADSLAFILAVRTGVRSVLQRRLKLRRRRDLWQRIRNPGHLRIRWWRGNSLFLGLHFRICADVVSHGQWQFRPIVADCQPRFPW